MTNTTLISDSGVDTQEKTSKLFLAGEDNVVFRALRQSPQLQSHLVPRRADAHIALHFLSNPEFAELILRRNGLSPRTGHLDGVLDVVCCAERPTWLPWGAFWIVPDLAVIVNLLQILHASEESRF